MELVIVVRRFEEPQTFEPIQAAERRVAWCLEQHRVRFLRSYMSRDGRSMVCFYEAPDAESVRLTQAKAGIPVESAWSAAVQRFRDCDVAPEGRVTVVVERELDPPVTLELVASVFASGKGCLGLHGAEPVASHLSKDGRRLLCIFDAPDAESVRIANRQMGVPVARAWPAELHLPPHA